MPGRRGDQLGIGPGGADVGAGVGDGEGGADAVADHAGLAGDLVGARAHLDDQVAGQARADVLDLAQDLQTVLGEQVDFGMNEHRVLLPSGEIRWQQWNARAIFNDDGKLIEFQSVGRDITDRVKMEEALRESEERYRIVTKHSADGVVVIRKGVLMYANDAFSYMCGYDDPRELIGRQVTDYIDPAQRAKFSDYMDSVETGRNTESVLQAIILRPDGKKIWGEGLHTVIRWGGDLAVLATVRDITKAKQREIESQRETTVLRRQNIQLASTIKDRYRFGDIIGKSPAMQEVYEQILAAGAGNANVVVYGESGTGKELVAMAIHQLSDHCDGSVCAGKLWCHSGKPDGKRVLSAIRKGLSPVRAAIKKAFWIMQTAGLFFWTKSETSASVCRLHAYEVDPQLGGAATKWSNPETGSRGTFIAAGPAYVRDDKVCRLFKANIVLGGPERVMIGTACRVGAGAWTLQKVKPLDGV